MIRNVHVDKAHEKPGHSVSRENLEIFRDRLQKRRTIPVKPGQVATLGDTSASSSNSAMATVASYTSTPSKQTEQSIATFFHAPLATNSARFLQHCKAGYLYK